MSKGTLNSTDKPIAQIVHDNDKDHSKINTTKEKEAENRFENQKQRGTKINKIHISFEIGR